MSICQWHIDSSEARRPMRSMVVGLANNTSIARLSAIINYVKPSTASGSPPFSREDICSYLIVNSIIFRKCSPRQTVICEQKGLSLNCSHDNISSPAAGAEGIHKWSVSVLREEKIFGRPFPRKRLSFKRSAFKPFSMMN